MDKYKASYYLHKRNETTLKVFKTFDEEVDYSFAVREATELSKMDKNSCFKSNMEKRDVDDLLFKHLKAVEVRGKLNLICSLRASCLKAMTGKWSSDRLA